MIKKYGLLYTIIYYDLQKYFISAIAILLLRGLFFRIICVISGIPEQSPLYPLIMTVLPFILWGFWAFFLFSGIRSRRYNYLTGRSYGYDAGQYKRSYHELVDYFRFDHAEPHKLDTSDFPVQTWRYTDGLIFGMDGFRIISIPSKSECNIAVFGPPGSGKTSGLAIINALRFEGSVLAIDIKGDIYNYCHKSRNIVRFCPDAEDALTESWHFDPFAGINDMSVTDRKLYIESMSTVLIPDEGGSSGSYFSTRARKYFQGIVHMLLYEDPSTTFPDVIHDILSGNYVDWVKKALQHECTEAKELLSPFYGNNEKNISSAYDCLCTNIYAFSNPILDELLTDNGNCISINVLEQGTDIYLQISQEHLDVYAPLFTLITQRFSMAFTKRPDSSSGKKNRPILMLLDEFPAMTYSYQLISSNLSTLRSRGIICMLIAQNLAQLEYRYQPIGARSILGNCNIQVILGSNDISSSEVFSKMFGSKKILKVSNSVSEPYQSSAGRSVQEAETQVFPPEYFGDLSSKATVILYFKGKYAELTKLNCYKDIAGWIYETR